LKPTEQCIQAARKAQSVLGMINRRFKIIAKQDYEYYIRPTSGHILNTIYRHGHHSYRKINAIGEDTKKEQLEWSKDLKKTAIRDQVEEVGFLGKTKIT